MCHKNTTWYYFRIIRVINQYMCICRALAIPVRNTVGKMSERTRREIEREKIIDEQSPMRIDWSKITHSFTYTRIYHTWHMYTKEYFAIRTKYGKIKRWGTKNVKYTILLLTSISEDSKYVHILENRRNLYTYTI